MYEPCDCIYRTSDIKKIWDGSTSFNKPIQSYITMIMHPRKSLRLINFALKILIINRIEVK